VRTKFVRVETLHEEKRRCCDRSRAVRLGICNITPPLTHATALLPVTWPCCRYQDLNATRYDTCTCARRNTSHLASRADQLETLLLVLALRTFLVHVLGLFLGFRLPHNQGDRCALANRKSFARSKKPALAKPFLRYPIFALAGTHASPAPGLLRLPGPWRLRDASYNPSFPGRSSSPQVLRLRLMAVRVCKVLRLLSFF